eukprot:1433493-Rhodomonas_salina.7
MPELTEPMASGCIKLYDCLHQPEDAVQMWQRMRMLDLVRPFSFVFLPFFSSCFLLRFLFRFSLSLSFFFFSFYFYLDFYNHGFLLSSFERRESVKERQRGRAQAHAWRGQLASHVPTRVLLPGPVLTSRHVATSQENAVPSLPYWPYSGTIPVRYPVPRYACPSMCYALATRCAVLRHGILCCQCAVLNYGKRATRCAVLREGIACYAVSSTDGGYSVLRGVRY